MLCFAAVEFTERQLRLACTLQHKVWKTPLEISVKSLKEFFTNKVSFSKPANYMLKVNSRNTRTRCKICSNDVFIINFEHISLLVLVFLLLTGSRYMPAGYVYVHVYIWESGGLNLCERFLLKLMENILAVIDPRKWYFL